MEPSLSTFEKLWAKNPTSILFARLADAYREKGDLDRAVAVCRRGLRYRPSYSTGHMVLGRCLLENGSIEEARQEFEKVLRLDPDHVAALQLLGRIDREAGLTEHALRRFRAAYAADPFSSELSQAVSELEKLCSPLGADAIDLADDRDAGAEAVDEDAVIPAPALRRFAGWAFPFQENLLSAEQGSARGRIPVDPDPEPGEDRAESQAADDAPRQAGAQSTEDRRVVTLTLADLYVSQGFVDRALDVLEALVASHPDDDRYRKRLQEIRTMGS